MAVEPVEKHPEEPSFVKLRFVTSPSAFSQASDRQPVVMRTYPVCEKPEDDNTL